MSIFAQMVTIASRIRPRPKNRLTDRVIYVNPDLSPSAGDNMMLIREIHDFYMAAHNFSDEEMKLLEDLKTGGFDVDRLQDEGILRFLSEREGDYRMPQNSLLKLHPEEMQGTLLEFNGRCYKIERYSVSYGGDPTVTVSRYQRPQNPTDDYKRTNMSIGPLLKKPTNGLELIALTLQQQNALLKTG